MKYYPISLDIKDKWCCVVGGGAVALRKVQSLRKAGALVRVVAPVVSKGLQRLAANKSVALIRGRYRKDCLNGVVLVIAATDDTAVNRHVSIDAARAKIFANIVDVPELCSFIVPSVIEKNGLVITVSTSGKAPSLARKISRDLTREFLPRYAGLVSVASKVRARLRRIEPDIKQRKVLMNRICRDLTPGAGCGRLRITQIIAKART
jgi:siroheme synthase-like protein